MDTQTSPAFPGSGGAPAARSSILSSTQHHKVKLYDFKRPDKFSKDQIRTVAFIHEALARSVTTRSRPCCG
jgi:flagellar motor switch protein FliM